MKKYFEFIDDKSCKFWEIETIDTNVTVRYGKIGTAGQTSEKSYNSASDAQKETTKLITEKTKKGYIEKGDATSQTESASTAPKIAPTKKTTPAKDSAANPKTAEPGKWIWMSYNKYIETYKQDPPRHPDLYWSDNCVILLNTGNAIFNSHFHTEFNIEEDFGKIENPEGLKEYNNLIVYVKGDMIVNGNFCDDRRYYANVQYVVDGTLYAKNMCCADSCFVINYAEIAQICAMIGNHGSYDGELIDAYYYCNDDHDVRACCTSKLKGKPSKHIKSGLFRDGATDAINLGDYICKEEEILICEDRQDGESDTDYYLRLASYSTSLFKKIPQELLNEQMYITAISNASTEGLKPFIKSLPPDILKSKEIWIQIIAKSYEFEKRIPKEFRDEVIKGAFAIKD